MVSPACGGVRALDEPIPEVPGVTNGDTRCDHRRMPAQFFDGRRSSIVRWISSAQRTASEMAATVAGTRFSPSQCASLEAAWIEAIIRFLPSSIEVRLAAPIFLCLLAAGCSTQDAYTHKSSELTDDDRRLIRMVQISPLGKSE
jgi:hypothetical protein